LNQSSIVRASYGDEARTFQYLPSAQETQAGYTLTASTPVIASLAKAAATVDTLKVTASGFGAKNIALSSYDTTLNVTVDAAGGDRWGGLNNPPIKSAGCGKALGTISKSGTYHIASAGGRGDYIIDIPTGYDKDKPYRLVFGMHGKGGAAVRVAEAEKGGGDDLSGFYSIKTMAAKDNIQCIYVAPQGNSDGTWDPTNDLKFFTDILNQVQSNLCVDTTRVFVTGFSFGVMYSYALSLAYPERIRAVATYAPANWNFNPQPTNRHIPIAYYQTTGTADDLCKWINNDAQKTGGKYCLLQHAQDNGCNTSGEIKLATSGTHVVTEFTGCNAGYPVKFSSFNGGHQAVASDPGSQESWIEKEAWAFFKQF
jgi:poly(3-hydroxybutyrate) depolymerase